MFGEFDEAAYLRANPDVKGMIDRGLVRSGFEHWYAVGANEHALGDRVSGFYEHDLMYDEVAYLRQNPDVADAVRARRVRNGYQHWIRFGRQEFARGVRLGPFSAKGGLFRPFVVALGDGAYLLVARAPEDFDVAESAEIRAGPAAPIALGSGAVSASRPIRVTDVCGAATSVRLIACAPPAELDLGRVAGRITLTVGRSGVEPFVSVYRDTGIQAFFFERADDANEFVRTTGTQIGAHEKRARVVDFAFAHLSESPKTVGYEPPIAIRVEEATAESDREVLLRGWVAVPRPRLEVCRVWWPETCEFFDLATTWTRTSRSDVAARFPDELGGAEDDHFGFEGVARFTKAPRDEGPRRLLLGVKEVGRPERWLEFEVSGR